MREPNPPDASTGQSPLASEGATRRKFLSAGATVAMTGGLVAGYGTLAGMAVGYLYPAGDPEQTGAVGWQFVATLDDLQPGDAFDYVAPSGASVVVARLGEGETADDIIALSSICPHLGCQVHWEPQNDRFFCPCHNGAFDREGKPTAGPPKSANQPLTQFPVKVEGRLVFVEAPLRVLGSGAGLADCRKKRDWLPDQHQIAECRSSARAPAPLIPPRGESCQLSPLRKLSVQNLTDRSWQLRPRGTTPPQAEV
jgi:Rieske Fe-S protein